MSNCIDEYFRLDQSLTKRDVESIKKTFSGLAKILYVDKALMDVDAVRELLIIAMKLRKRVKDSLARENPKEFGNVRFSFEEKRTTDRSVAITINDSSISSDSINLDI